MRVMFSTPEANIEGEVTPPVNWDDVIDVRTDDGELVRVNGWMFGEDDIEILDEREITALERMADRYVHLRNACEQLDRFSRTAPYPANTIFLRAHFLRRQLEHLHGDIATLWSQAMGERGDHRPYSMLIARVAKLDRRLNIMRTEAAQMFMSEPTERPGAAEWWGANAIGHFADKLDNEPIVDAEVIQ